MSGILTISVSRESWERLRKLLETPHEHCDGINECPICDEPLVDAAVNGLQARDERVRLLEGALSEVCAGDRDTDRDGKSILFVEGRELIDKLDALLATSGGGTV